MESPITLSLAREPGRNAAIVPDEDGQQGIGITFRPDLPVEEFRDFGHSLRRAEQGIAWAFADYSQVGIDRYGLSLDELAAILGTIPPRVEGFAAVARGVPRQRRRPNLAFRIHQLVLDLPPDEGDRWLTEAEVEGLTPEQLRILIPETEAKPMPQAGRPTQPPVAPNVAAPAPAPPPVDAPTLIPRPPAGSRDVLVAVTAESWALLQAIVSAAGEEVGRDVTTTEWLESRIAEEASARDIRFLP